MPLPNVLRKSFRLISLICAGSLGLSQPLPVFALRPSLSPKTRELVLARLEEATIEPMTDSILNDWTTGRPIDQLLEQLSKMGMGGERIGNLKGRMRDPRFSFVARDKNNSRIIGLAVAAFLPEKTADEIQLSVLVVDQNRYREGIGRQLFEAVSDAARAAGFDRLVWNTPKWNRDGQAFYDSIPGVERIPSDLFLDPAVHYQRRLRPSEAAAAVSAVGPSTELRTGLEEGFFDDAGSEKNRRPAAAQLLMSQPDIEPVLHDEAGARAEEVPFRTKDHRFGFIPKGENILLFAHGSRAIGLLTLEERLEYPEPTVENWVSPPDGELWQPPVNARPKALSHRKLVVRRGEEVLFSWQGKPGELESVVHGYDYSRRSRILTVYLDPSRRPELDPKSRAFKVSGSPGNSRRSKTHRRATLRLVWAEPRPTVTEFKDLFIQPGEKGPLDRTLGLHFYVTVDLHGKSDEMRRLALQSEEISRYRTDYILSGDVPESTREEILALIEGQIQGRLTLNLPDRWEQFLNWVHRRWLGRILLNVLGRQPRHFALEPINLYPPGSGETQAVRFHGFLPASTWAGVRGASAVLEFSNNGEDWRWRTAPRALSAGAPLAAGGSTSLTTGLEETDSDVSPSDDERLARMVFEVPRGGPRQYLRLLAEAKRGRGMVVIPASAFDQFSGLEEFLSRLVVSPELSRSFVVWGDTDPVDRVESANSFVRIFRKGSPLELAAYLAGLEEAEGVGVLGTGGAVQLLTATLSSQGVFARTIGWNLLEILSTLGVQQDVLIQVGLEEISGDLLRAQGA